MTRVGRLGVLAVVACVVLWGGAAAATAAPLTAASDAPTDTAATSTQQEANSTLQEENATVTFDDQNATDSTITVSNVTLPEGGYVAIHDSSLLDGNVIGSVIGVSDYLQPGTHEDVTFELFMVPDGNYDRVSLEGTETLVAMPHMETTGDTLYNFLASNGTEDGPYLVDGEAVTATANVTVADGDDAGSPDDESE